MTAAPTRLNRFEYDLVRILRFLLGALPPEQVVTALHQQRPAPPCLSANCIRLVQETLRKGLVQFLVRGGGWRNEHYLRDGVATPGRVWQRLPLEERTLAFSARPLQFLIWLTAERPSEARSAWAPSPTPPTIADHLFFLLVQQHLPAHQSHWTVIARSSVFQDNPLARLFHPAEFDGPLPDFATLYALPAPAILESLQPLLTQRWIDIDHGKESINDWTQLRLQGEREAATLAAFLTAAETAGRRDLARFVLRALAKRLSEAEPALALWTRSLSQERPTRLADRIATRRAALSLVQQMPTLARGEQQARTVSYFEENYAAAQWWKAEYEAYHGRSLSAKAERLLRQTDPLNRNPA
ncbi:hypothetical protein BH11PLA2_BH11PLA2_01270 [soil metagenome]